MLACTLLASVASAQPTVYYLSGFIFSDGGTASGSFTYDPVTNRYTNVNITTTPGTVRTTGATYTLVCGQDVPTCTGVAPGPAGYLNLTTNAADQTGLPAMSIFFPLPLSSLSLDFLGLPIRSVFALEANCSGASCAAPAGPSRSTSSGVLTTAEPSMLMLWWFS